MRLSCTTFQVCMCSSGDVNVFQWNRDFFWAQLNKVSAQYRKKKKKLLSLKETNSQTHHVGTLWHWKNWIKLHTTLLIRDAGRQHDGRARSIVLALKIHICWKRNKIDPPIRTEYCLSGGATTLISSWVGTIPSVSLSCAHWSLGTWWCCLATRHWRTSSRGCQRHTSSRSGKKCLGFCRLLCQWYLAGKNSRNGNIRCQQRWCFRLRAHFSASCWNFLQSLWGLCRIKSNEAKCLFDTTNDLPFCCGSERVSALRGDPHQIHWKHTISQIPMKDGLRQSVTFENGHCLQYTSPESLIMPVVRPEADRDKTGSPRTWRARWKSKIWSAISMHCVEIRAATRLTSSVSYRRPRTRSQVHCFFHDPGQRDVPCSSTAFRRRTIRLNHWRLYQWRLQQWSSGDGVSSIRLVSIAALSVSFSMPSIWAVTGVSSSMHESSMRANSSRRRSLLVDVELELRAICVPCGVTSMVSTICSCIRSTTTGISRTIACSCTAEFSIMFCVIFPATICSWWTWLYTGSVNSSKGGSEPTTRGASRELVAVCGFIKLVKEHSSCIRSTTEIWGISWTITNSCTAGCSTIFKVISPVTICSWWTWLYTGASDSKEENEPTTCGEKGSTAVLENCGYTKPIMSRLTSVVTVVVV